MFGIFRKPVAGTRKTAGGWVGGVWTEPTESQITIQASVQPADTDQLQLLPEGRRLTGSYAIFTSDTLQITIEANGDSPGVQGDILNLPGGQYEVMARELWRNNLINHNVYIVSRVVS